MRKCWISWKLCNYRHNRSVMELYSYVYSKGNEIFWVVSNPKNRERLIICCSTIGKILNRINIRRSENGAQRGVHRIKWPGLCNSYPLEAWIIGLEIFCYFTSRKFRKSAKIFENKEGDFIHKTWWYFFMVYIIYTNLHFTFLCVP